MEKKYHEDDSVMVRCSWCGRECDASILDEGPIYCSESCEMDADDSRNRPGPSSRTVPCEECDGTVTVSTNEYGTYARCDTCDFVDV